MNQKIATLSNKVHPAIWQALSVGIALLVFYLILINRSPFILRPVSMALRTGFGVIIPIAALVLYGIFRIPGRLGSFLSLTATLSLFALGLAGLWASGQTQSIALSGLIPVSDAQAYYMDASRILHGMSITQFTGMRPLFAGLFSTFLLLTDQNLMAALGIFTAIAGLAAYLTVSELKKTHGAETAVFFLMLIFLYYRHHSGTTMSETLGVSFGLLGLALTWQGLSTKREWFALLGIATIALALNVRPGAMFVLPALLLWGGWVFRGQKKLSIRFLLIGILLIGLSFYANNLMIRALFGEKGVAFENFAWAFYGLASGGKSWTYVFEANPQLRLLPDNEVTPTIYKLAFELILSNPLLLVKGAFFYWKMFFSNTWYNAYSFVAGDNYWVNEAARWGMYILGGLGVFRWFKNRTDPFVSLAVIGALGVLTSVPFVPPTDAYRVRLYAATIPFFALLPVLGFSFLLEKSKLRFLSQGNLHVSSTTYSSMAFSITLTLVMLATPVLIKSSGKTPPLPESSCPQEMDSIFVRYNKGTYVNVLRENVQFLDWMPDFHMSVFRRNAHSLADTALTTRFESISLPSTLFYAVDLQSGSEALVIIDTNLLPEPNAFLHLCGFWENDPAISVYKLFEADHVAGWQ